MPKIRNIIIFIAIVAAFVLFYIFFIKSPSSTTSLVSSPANTTLPNVNGTSSDTNIPNGTSLVARDFLTLLLNVKNIKLNDAIFSDPAFNNLHDSSIILTPDGTEGRVNPFAKFGSDLAPLPINIPNPPSVTPPPTIPPIVIIP